MKNKNILKSIFITQNKNNIEIEECPHDKDFLHLKNTTLEQGNRLCAYYGASGSSLGINQEHFQIGNFGRYKTT